MFYCIRLRAGVYTCGDQDKECAINKNDEWEKMPPQLMLKFREMEQIVHCATPPIQTADQIRLQKASNIFGHVFFCGSRLIWIHFTQKSAPQTEFAFMNNYSTKLLESIRS